MKPGDVGGVDGATDQEKPIAAAVRPGAAGDWMPSLTSWSIMTQPCTRTWCNWSALLVLPGTRAMKTTPAQSRVTGEEDWPVARATRPSSCWALAEVDRRQVGVPRARTSGVRVWYFRCGHSRGAAGSAG